MTGISSNTKLTLCEIILFSEFVNLILISCSAPTESEIKNCVLSEGNSDGTELVIRKFPSLSYEKDSIIFSLM